MGAVEPHDEGGADVARRMRAEHRAAQEVVEAETEQMARAARPLRDVVVEYMHRGDTVRVRVGLCAWAGQVVHVGRTMMSLRTTGGSEVDVGLARLSSIRVVARSAVGGSPIVSGDPAGLMARLRELERTGETVELGGAGVDPAVQGRVRAVAPEHIEVDGVDGSEWVLALRAVDYVIRGGA